MNYFAQFLKTEPPGSLKPAPDIVAEFHHAWSVVRYTLRNPDERQLARGIQSTNVPASLKTITDHLVSEATRTEEGTTGGCLEYLLKNDVLGELVRLSQNDRPFGVQAQVLRTIGNMVCMLDEHFLVHTAVHRPLLKLLKICVGDELDENLDGRGRVMGAASISQKSKPSQYEEDLVDLLCTLCSRIRTYRDLLMIFFYDKRWFRPPSPLDEYNSDDEESEGHPADSDTRLEAQTVPSDLTLNPDQSMQATGKPEYEFIIFNYLLRFVHREGRIGDFARAGMLFLIDVAMECSDSSFPGIKSDSPAEVSRSDPASEAAYALADYILEGDFAEVLSAGIAAVYSLLPSKLKLVPRVSSNPSSGLVLSMEDSQRSPVEEPPGISMGSTNTRDFCGKLDHFLIILEFIQDVLRRDHCGAREHHEQSLANSVLLAIRKVFLDNILYPSILESSESDGSSVAIMSYLEASFRALAPGPLVSFLLDYLISDGDESEKKPSNTVEERETRAKSAKQAAKMRRRKSSAMILLEMEVPVTHDNPNYVKSFGRFTLKDLIKSNLGSENAQAATAALQLLQTLMHLHCEISIGRVVNVSPMTNGSPLWWHEASTELMADLPTVEYLDHDRAIQMYRKLAERDEDPLDIAFSTSYAHYVEDGILELLNQRCYRDQAGVHLHAHCLRPGDPILKTVVGSLCRFFLHTPQQNMVLTGLLVKLALCPHRSLKGWLVGENRPTLTNQDADSEWGSGLRREGTSSGSQPIVYRILQELFSGLNVQRMVIDDFERLLRERRQGLLFSENLQDAMRIPLDVEQPRGDGEMTTAGEGLSTPTKRGKSSFLSFLTPTKRTPAKVRGDRPEVKGRDGERMLASNPFKEHYEETRGMRTEAPVAELEDEEGWLEGERWGGGEEDVFGTSGVWEDGYGSGRRRGHEGTGRGGERLVSEVLDNVVILEECVKELAGVIDARGCLGV